MRLPLDSSLADRIGILGDHGNALGPHKARMRWTILGRNLGTIQYLNLTVI